MKHLKALLFVLSTLWSQNMSTVGHLVYVFFNPIFKWAQDAKSCTDCKFVNKGVEQYWSIILVGVRPVVGARKKLTPCLSYYQWRYLHMYILEAPIVCAYCNSAMITFEHFTKHASSPMDSHFTSSSALTPWPPVSVKVWHGNQADTLTTRIGFHRGRNLNSWTGL